MHSRAIILLLLILSLTSRAEADAVEMLIAEALGAHPELVAAEARWQAAVARAEAAGSLPDPVLSAGVFLEPVETRVGPQRAKLGLRQRLPWFGELGLSREMAGLRAEAEAQRYRGTRLHIRRDIKRALAEDWFLARSERVLGAQLDLLEQTESVLRSRYRAGAASRSELLRLQVEQGQLQSRAADLVDARLAAKQRLAAALGWEGTEKLATLDSLPSTPSAAVLNASASAALAASPALLALASESERAERGIELVGKAGNPDFTLGLDWIETGPARMDGVAGSGKDPLALSLSFNIPLWRGNVAAERRAAAAERRAAAANWQAESLDLAAMLESTLADYGEALRRGRLHAETLLPAAQESAALTLASYRSGRVGFDALLDVQRLLIELELGQARAEADRYRFHAEIEALAGLDDAAPANEESRHD